MVDCSVCKTKNDDLSTICSNCGSYIQNRVANLNFFSTIWKVIESPTYALRIISISEHKNYGILLYIFFGIYNNYLIIWLNRLGNKYDNIISLIIFVIFNGIVFGLILCIFISVFHYLLSKLLCKKSSLRISFGLTAYSLVPFLISLFILLPLKILTFGIYLFTSNPSPISINPVSYIILSIFEIICGFWSLFLLIKGFQVHNNCSYLKSFLLSLLLISFHIFIVFSIILLR